MTTQNIEIADRMALRRARRAKIMGLVLIITQGANIGVPAGEPEFSALRFATLTLWIAIMAIFILFGSGLWRGKAVRDLLNDETTLAHRRTALACGYWGAMAAAAFAYAMALFGGVTTEGAIRLVMGFGAAFALIKFGNLEKQSILA